VGAPSGRLRGHRVEAVAGERSLARSAFKEAAEQLTRAISQTDALPDTPTSRREEIKLHAALRNVLFPRSRVKTYYFCLCK
jgi:hypothetical protein